MAATAEARVAVATAAAMVAEEMEAEMAAAAKEEETAAKRTVHRSPCSLLQKRTAHPHRIS